MIAVGFSEGDGIGDFIIDLSTASGDTRKQSSHCFLWKSLDAVPGVGEVIHSLYGYGVLRESITDFKARFREFRLLVPPPGTDLQPAIDWAKACIGQPYDMRRNVQDAVHFIVGTLFGLRFVDGVAGALRRFGGRFRGGLTFKPPAPTDSPAKNCVALDVWSVQNCPTVKGRETLSPGLRPTELEAALLNLGWTYSTQQGAHE